MVRKHKSRGERAAKMESEVVFQMQGLDKGAAYPAAILSILSNHRVPFHGAPTPLTPRSSSDARC